ncbi:MAG: efflux RND transporter periplasmic adaptor subunit [Rikenellaceae bacterium]
MKRVFIAALMMALVVSCGAQDGSTKSTEATQQEQAPVAVITKSSPAVAATIDLKEVFTSEIEPYKENDITPSASGVRIDKIMYDIGDNVREGAVVATLDPTIYNQQMISVNNLQADYDRLLPVYEAGGISKQTLDQAKASLDVQREIAANIKKNIEILSPISGVVTARNGEAGDLFVNQPIFHIAQIDKMKVLVSISEQYFTSVKVGMPVELTLDIYPDEIFDGKVSLIYPALDASTRTFTVEVTAPNSGMKLRPGMHGRTTFNMGNKEAIMVPDIAVQKQFGSAENFVYVAKNGVAERRRVVTGRKVGSEIDILSGVEVGEEVLTTAFSRLSDGTEINIKK